MHEGQELAPGTGATEGESLTERIEAVSAQIKELTSDSAAEGANKDEALQAQLIAHVDQIVSDIQAIERDNPAESDDFAETENHATIAAMLHSIRMWATQKDWGKACRGLEGYLDYVRGKIPDNEVVEDVSEEEDFRQAA